VSNVRSAAEEIALAEQCDAEGDHDAAINALSRATGLGDVEATTRLAKRLITGYHAPLLGKEGAGLLVDAANRGGAEAAARLAVLVAAGAYVEASVERALGLIATAAERGWRSAQSQLLALTPDRELASAAELSPQPDVWPRLAASVDLPMWMSSPGGTSLSVSRAIRAFEKMLPDSVCQWLIDRSAGRLKRALVYDAAGGKNYESETRTNSWAQFDLMSCEFLHVLVQLRMQAASGIPLVNMESTAVLHYAVGEQISDHFDFVSPNVANYEQELQKNGQRVMTFLIYLNDDYAGGETAFPKLGVVHKGRRGEGLYFVNALPDASPDLRTLHAGRPPTEGEKWIVSQFIRDRRLLAV
jgi:prolyl 4-hydroxylase